MTIQLSEKAAAALRLLKTLDATEAASVKFLADHANEHKALPMSGREGLCRVIAEEITLLPAS